MKKKHNKTMDVSFPFRSFHNQRFDLRTALFICLPIIFNLIMLHLLPHVTQFWGAFLEYVLPRLGYNGNIIYSKYMLFNTYFLLPAISINANLPSLTLWWGALFISVGLFLLSFLITDPYTPLKYFLRGFLILVWISQLYMLIFPNGFLYNIFFYTKSGFMQIVSLLFVTPWVFLFSYYLFGYRIINKLILTVCALTYFVVLAPFQYLLNACIINKLSLLMMPPLFFYAGLVMNILAIVAFCGYGVSNVPKYYKYRTRA